MSNKKFDIIYCPECGMEYLPAEIYLPNELLGKPYNIMKDYLGKIIEYFGKSMDLKETYTCDRCNTKFKVSAKVSFKSETLEKESFNKDYETKIPTKLSLFED